MKQYQYQPLDMGLDEIRLVDLMPGSIEDDLRLRIYNAPLKPPIIKRLEGRMTLQEVQKTLPEDWVVRKTLEDRYMFCPGSDRLRSWNHPDPNFDHSQYSIQERGEVLEYQTTYEALSYTWGDPSRTIEVFIQGSSNVLTTTKISKNLAFALRHLRLPLQTRTLWVDALCINQDDITERNSQVKRMDKVYRFARLVLVWLGEAADGSDQAIRTLEHFGQQIEITQQNTIGEAPEAEEPHWWNPQVPIPYSEETWHALTAILLRPWFARVWVVQEAHLGGNRTKVQCGQSTVAWSAFIKMVMILGIKTALTREQPGLFKVLSLVKPSVTEIGDADDFPRLLNAVRDRQCLNPRDKVYGLLGILSSTISSQIKADYESPVADVYENAVLADINTSKRIQMLQSCDIETRIPEGPSWVPNWAGLAGRQQLSTYFGGIGRISLDTSGSTPANYIPPNVLEVVGKQCAEVLNISAPTSGTVEEQVSAFREIAPSYLENDTYITGGSLLDAYITITSMGLVKERFPHSVLYPSIVDLRTKYQAEMSSSHQKPDIQGKASDYLNGTKFFSTKEGYIGATRASTLSSDIVSFILGVDNPMILRPASDGHFLVVGSCFVHGLMNAEPVLGPISNEWEFILTRDRGYPEKSYAFINQGTGERTKDDPRLSPLPTPWKRTEDGYRNQETGKLVQRDPRLAPDALREHCPSLTTLRLI